MEERISTIPEQAKKVFEGVIFDVYHWPLTDFDGNERVFERLKRLDSAIVVPVTDEGKVLIARQQQPHKPEYLGCFGGQIEHGEASRDAAGRELLEESGMTAGSLELWFSERSMEKIEWVCYFYIARGVKKTSEVLWDGGERLWPIELSVDEFVDWLRSNECTEKILALRVLREITGPGGIEGLRERLLRQRME